MFGGFIQQPCSDPALVSLQYANNAFLCAERDEVFILGDNDLCHGSFLTTTIDMAIKREFDNKLNARGHWTTTQMGRSWKCIEQIFFLSEQTDRTTRLRGKRVSNFILPYRQNSLCSGATVEIHTVVGETRTVRRWKRRKL